MPLEKCDVEYVAENNMSSILYAVQPLTLAANLSHSSDPPVGQQLPFGGLVL